jgi:amidase
MAPDDPRSAAAGPLSRRAFIATSGAAAMGAHLGTQVGAPFNNLESRKPVSDSAMTSAPSSNIVSLTLVDLAAKIRKNELTSEAAVRAFLAQIDAVNPQLNAVVQIQHDAAMAKAREADGVPHEKRGALHGVPITIKDSLDTAEIISTGGTKGRANYVPPRDATAVARLRAAGAIILGKTNTPDLTMAFETNNLVYGRTNNPFDVARTPGGSSGGAAAIVAAHGSPLDIGSDTGGSIRVPSHFCGIAGIKPTAGRVSRAGHIIDFAGPCESLTHIGPLAKTVDDLALALHIIAGPDHVDPHVVAAPLGDHTKVPVKNLRVAYFIDLGSLKPTAETANCVEHALKTLEKAGCKHTAIEIPGADDIYNVYTGLIWGDGGAGMTRILARWGTTESPLFDRIKAATVLSSADYSAQYEKFDNWRSSLLSLFTDFDVIICPVNGGPAPLHGTFSRPAAAYTQLFDLTGWPSTVIRAGTSPEGLPLGIQCVAHPWREDLSLAVAKHLETAFGPFPGPSLTGRS